MSAKSIERVINKLEEQFNSLNSESKLEQIETLKKDAEKALKKVLSMEIENVVFNEDMLINNYKIEDYLKEYNSHINTDCENSTIEEDLERINKINKLEVIIEYLRSCQNELSVVEL